MYYSYRHKLLTVVKIDIYSIWCLADSLHWNILIEL